MSNGGSGPRDPSIWWIVHGGMYRETVTFSSVVEFFDQHAGVALFWATLAVAVGTFVLALGTVKLAFSTSKGVKLQEQELTAVEGELKLAREQFAYAQAAARPQLDVDVTVYERPEVPNTVLGSVRYVHGSEPAYDIEVWVKVRTGSFGKSLGTILTPSVAEARFALGDIPDEMFKRWPFPEARKLPLLEGSEFWAGVTWRSTDGTKMQRRYKQFEDGTRVENPAVTEPVEPIELDRERQADFGFTPPPIDEPDPLKGS
jgi:hypothetical protein